VRESPSVCSWTAGVENSSDLASGEAPGAEEADFAKYTDTGPIVASILKNRVADDSSQAGPMLERVGVPVSSVVRDGTFDRDDLCPEVAARHPDSDVTVPPRSSAVPSGTGESTRTRGNRYP
jgi:hypothetical protein